MSDIRKIATELEENEILIRRGIDALYALWEAAEYGHTSIKDHANALWFICRALSDQSTILQKLTEQALEATNDE